MKTYVDRLIYKLSALEVNDQIRAIFESLGQGRNYTDEQKECAFDLIDEFGIRATAKILKLPRRTLQRWCRKHKVNVKRAPDWIYKWAERRRKRNEFWQKRGY